MATVKVSNASQLNSAIRSASNGDTIQLKAGNYGSVTINGISKSITLTSEQGSNPASLSGLTLRNSANIKVDDLKFTGSGNAVAINDSRNITIQDSSFAGNKKGIAVNRADDITIRNNDFTKMNNDAIAMTGVDGALIVGNQVKNMATGGGAHHDMIQIHPTHGASSNITIRNNVLDSNDTFTQAIYIGSGTTHRNITIDDNTITSGHKYGIQVVSNVRGLDITDNVVVQDQAVNSSSDRYVPEINVSRGSSDVEITGNTAHEIYSGSGSGWKVFGNTIVKPGSKVTDGGTGSGTGGGGTTSVVTKDTDTTVTKAGSGKTVTADGDSINGWTKVVARNMDLDGGDTIVLRDFDAGTFVNGNDGNALAVSDGGRDVTIDSRADVEEIIARSSDVRTKVEGDDTLVLRISQDDGTMALRLVNLGDVDALL
ncbi:right-handed parallel beta-helix repeat-containing protein [Amaricoccus tamworthensis]|uniref:right-handed parallel beta-helix repeat-containing protein n=1 Tax=Amaricoccus tamworthensis TaxID=57002 RepID=UPI003C7ECDFF